MFYRDPNREPDPTIDPSTLSANTSKITNITNQGQIDALPPESKRLLPPDALNKTIIHKLYHVPIGTPNILPSPSSSNDYWGPATNNIYNLQNLQIKDQYMQFFSPMISQPPKFSITFLDTLWINETGKIVFTAENIPLLTSPQLPITTSNGNINEKVRYDDVFIEIKLPFDVEQNVVSCFDPANPQFSFSKSIHEDWYNPTTFITYSKRDPTTDTYQMYGRLHLYNLPVSRRFFSCTADIKPIQGYEYHANRFTSQVTLHGGDVYNKKYSKSDIKGIAQEPAENQKQVVVQLNAPIFFETTDNSQKLKYAVIRSPQPKISISGLAVDGLDLDLNLSGYEFKLHANEILKFTLPFYFNAQIQISKNPTQSQTNTGNRARCKEDEVYCNAGPARIGCVKLLYNHDTTLPVAFSSNDGNNNMTTYIANGFDLRFINPIWTVHNWTCDVMIKPILYQGKLHHDRLPTVFHYTPTTYQIHTPTLVNSFVDEYVRFERDKRQYSLITQYPLSGVVDPARRSNYTAFFWFTVDQNTNNTILYLDDVFNDVEVKPYYTKTVYSKSTNKLSLPSNHSLGDAIKDMTLFTNDSLSLWNLYGKTFYDGYTNNNQTSMRPKVDKLIVDTTSLRIVDSAYIKFGHTRGGISNSNINSRNFVATLAPPITSSSYDDDDDNGNQQQYQYYNTYKNFYGQSKRGYPSQYQPTIMFYFNKTLVNLYPSSSPVLFVQMPTSFVKLPYTLEAKCYLESDPLSMLPYQAKFEQIQTTSQLSLYALPLQNFCSNDNILTSQNLETELSSTAKRIIDRVNEVGLARCVMYQIEARGYDSHSVTSANIDYNDLINSMDFSDNSENNNTNTNKDNDVRSKNNDLILNSKTKVWLGTTKQNFLLTLFDLPAAPEYNFLFQKDETYIDGILESQYRYISENAISRENVDNSNDLDQVPFICSSPQADLSSSTITTTVLSNSSSYSSTKWIDGYNQIYQHGQPLQCYHNPKYLYHSQQTQNGVNNVTTITNGVHTYRLPYNYDKSRYIEPIPRQYDDIDSLLREPTIVINNNNNNNNNNRRIPNQNHILLYNNVTRNIRIDNLKFIKIGDILKFGQIDAYAISVISPCIIYPENDGSGNGKNDYTEPTILFDIVNGNENHNHEASRINNSNNNNNKENGIQQEQKRSYSDSFKQKNLFWNTNNNHNGQHLVATKEIDNNRNNNLYCVMSITTYFAEHRQYDDKTRVNFYPSNCNTNNNNHTIVTSTSQSLTTTTTTTNTDTTTNNNNEHCRFFTTLSISINDYITTFYATIAFPQQYTVLQIKDINAYIPNTVQYLEMLVSGYDDPNKEMRFVFNGNIYDINIQNINLLKYKYTEAITLDTNLDNDHDSNNNGMSLVDIIPCLDNTCKFDKVAFWQTTLIRIAFSYTNINATEIDTVYNNYANNTVDKPLFPFLQIPGWVSHPAAVLDKQQLPSSFSSKYTDSTPLTLWSVQKPFKPSDFQGFSQLINVFPKLGNYTSVLKFKPVLFLLPRQAEIFKIPEISQYIPFVISLYNFPDYYKEFTMPLFNLSISAPERPDITALLTTPHQPHYNMNSNIFTQQQQQQQQQQPTTNGTPFLKMTDFLYQGQLHTFCYSVNQANLILFDVMLTINNNQTHNQTQQQQVSNNIYNIQIDATFKPRFNNIRTLQYVLNQTTYTGEIIGNGTKQQGDIEYVRQHVGEATSCEFSTAFHHPQIFIEKLYGDESPNIDWGPESNTTGPWPAQGIASIVPSLERISILSFDLKLKTLFGYPQQNSINNQQTVPSQQQQQQQQQQQDDDDGQLIGINFYREGLNSLNQNRDTTPNSSTNAMEILDNNNNNNDDNNNNNNNPKTNSYTSIQFKEQNLFYGEPIELELELLQNHVNIGDVVLFTFVPEVENTTTSLINYYQNQLKINICYDPEKVKHLGDNDRAICMSITNNINYDQFEIPPGGTLPQPDSWIDDGRYDWLQYYNNHTFDNYNSKCFINQNNIFNYPFEYIKYRDIYYNTTEKRVHYIYKLDFDGIIPPPIYKEHNINGSEEYTVKYQGKLDNFQDQILQYRYGDGVRVIQTSPITRDNNNNNLNQYNTYDDGNIVVDDVWSNAIQSRRPSFSYLLEYEKVGYRFTTPRPPSSSLFTSWDNTSNQNNINSKETSQCIGSTTPGPFKNHVYGKIIPLTSTLEPAEGLTTTDRFVFQITNLSSSSLQQDSTTSTTTTFQSSTTWADIKCQFSLIPMSTHHTQKGKIYAKYYRKHEFEQLQQLAKSSNQMYQVFMQYHDFANNNNTRTEDNNDNNNSDKDDNENDIDVMNFNYNDITQTINTQQQTGVIPYDTQQQQFVVPYDTHQIPTENPPVYRFFRKTFDLTLETRTIDIKQQIPKTPIARIAILPTFTPTPTHPQQVVNLTLHTTINPILTDLLIVVDLNNFVFQTFYGCMVESKGNNDDYIENNDSSSNSNDNINVRLLADYHTASPFFKGIPLDNVDPPYLQPLHEHILRIYINQTIEKPFNIICSFLTSDFIHNTYFNNIALHKHTQQEPTTTISSNNNNNNIHNHNHLDLPKLDATIDIYKLLNYHAIQKNPYLSLKDKLNILPYTSPKDVYTMKYIEYYKLTSIWNTTFSSRGVYNRPSVFKGFNLTINVPQEYQYMPYIIKTANRQQIVDKVLSSFVLILNDKQKIDITSNPASYSPEYDIRVPFVQRFSSEDIILAEQVYNHVTQQLTLLFIFPSSYLYDYPNTTNIIDNDQNTNNIADLQDYQTKLNNSQSYYERIAKQFFVFIPGKSEPRDVVAARESAENSSSNGDTTKLKTFSILYPNDDWNNITPFTSITSSTWNNEIIQKLKNKNDAITKSLFEDKKIKFVLISNDEGSNNNNSNTNTTNTNPNDVGTNNQTTAPQSPKYLQHVQLDYGVDDDNSGGSIQGYYYNAAELIHDVVFFPECLPSNRSLIPGVNSFNQLAGRCPKVSNGFPCATHQDCFSGWCDLQFDFETHSPMVIQYRQYQKVMNELNRLRQERRIKKEQQESANAKQAAKEEEAKQAETTKRSQEKLLQEQEEKRLKSIATYERQFLVDAARNNLTEVEVKEAEARATKAEAAYAEAVKRGEVADIAAEAAAKKTKEEEAQKKKVEIAVQKKEDEAFAKKEKALENKAKLLLSTSSIARSFAAHTAPRAVQYGRVVSSGVCIQHPYTIIYDIHSTLIVDNQKDNKKIAQANDNNSNNNYEHDKKNKKDQKIEELYYKDALFYKNWKEYQCNNRLSSTHPWCQKNAIPTNNNDIKRQQRIQSLFEVFEEYNNNQQKHKQQQTSHLQQLEHILGHEINNDIDDDLYLDEQYLYFITREANPRWYEQELAYYSNVDNVDMQDDVDDHHHGNNKKSTSSYIPI